MILPHKIIGTNKHLSQERTDKSVKTLIYISFSKILSQHYFISLK